jgi:hypothetical protein
MRHTSIFLAFGLTAAVMSGCASYDPSSAPVPMPATGDWYEADGLAASVDPYVDVERQKKVFDADMNAADVIPLQVSVENRTSRSQVVRPSDMILVLNDNRAFSPASVSATVNKVGESGSVVGATLAFGLVGYLVASNSEDTARTARAVDYKEKSFRDVTLAAGDKANGFVFFIPPKGTQPFDDATLRVRFVDFDGSSSEMVDVKLTGLGYIETVKKSNNDVKPKP